MNFTQLVIINVPFIPHELKEVTHAAHSPESKRKQKCLPSAPAGSGNTQHHKKSIDKDHDSPAARSYTSIYTSQLQVTRRVEKLSGAHLSARLQVLIGVVLLWAKSNPDKEHKRLYNCAYSFTIFFHYNFLVFVFMLHSSIFN